MPDLLLPGLFCCCCCPLPRHTNSSVVLWEVYQKQAVVLVLLGWTLGQADIQQIECILLPRLLEAHGMC